jgi:hypothetical protein
MSRRYGAASAQAGVSLGVTTSSEYVPSRTVIKRGVTKAKSSTNRGDSVERRPVRTTGLVTLNIDQCPNLDHHAVAGVAGETSAISVSEADEVARAPIDDSDERRDDDGAKRGRSTLTGRASEEQTALGIDLGKQSGSRRSKNGVSDAV